MSLKYALLTVLSYQPLSGYDLIRHFDGSVGNVWYATHPQIYRELQRLRRAKLVSSRLVVQQGRPDKKVYSLTSAGWEDLLAWVATPPEVPRQKDGLLLRAFSYGRIDPTVAIARLREHRGRLQEGLAELHRLKDAATRWPEGPLRIGSLLTIEAGIIYGEGYTRWCDWAIDVLRQPRHASRRVVRAARAARGGRSPKKPRGPIAEE